MPLDLTRSLIVVLMPGALGLSGWLLSAALLFPQLFEFYGKYEHIFLGTTFVATVVAGLLFESLGTQLENDLDNCHATGESSGLRSFLRKRMNIKRWLRYFIRTHCRSQYKLRVRLRSAPRLKGDSTMYYEWFDYLSWMPENEPVGFKFLSKKATTLYFNLAMVSAAPVSAMGYAALSYILLGDSRREIVALLFLVLGLCVSKLFRRATNATQEAMILTRREMNARFKEARVSPKNN